MIIIKIKTENAAFCDSNGNQDETARAMETARILRRIAAKIENGGVMSFSERDSNGNRVASVEEK